MKIRDVSVDTASGFIMDVKNLMPGVNFTDDITPEDFIDVMNIAVPEGPSDYTDMLDTIILNTDGSRNPLDTFTIDSDGLKDYGFECCLRAMDRLYNFSYCIPDFEPATYVVPPLPVYSCHRGRNLWGGRSTSAVTSAKYFPLAGRDRVPMGI